MTAPHDGYIVEINVKAGDSYDGKTAAHRHQQLRSGDAVLRADTSKIEKKIDKGTQVTVKRDSDKTLTKKVTDSGVDEEGKRYIDVKLTDKDIGKPRRRRGAVLRRGGDDGQLSRVQLPPRCSRPVPFAAAGTADTSISSARKATRSASVCSR